MRPSAVPPPRVQAIGRLFEKTMMAAFGPENLKDNFIAFDTICDATQVRQDAISEMSESAEEQGLDFILVVGGWDSSNTAHLLEIPHAAGLTGYHVNTAACIRPDNSVEHRDVDGAVQVAPLFAVAARCACHGGRAAGGRRRLLTACIPPSPPGADLG